jgi:hypothetical protein
MSFREIEMAINAIEDSVTVDSSAVEEPPSELTQ